MLGALIFTRGFHLSFEHPPFQSSSNLTGLLVVGCRRARQARQQAAASNFKCNAKFSLPPRPIRRHNFPVWIAGYVEGFLTCVKETRKEGKKLFDTWKIRFDTSWRSTYGRKYLIAREIGFWPPKAFIQGCAANSPWRDRLNVRSFGSLMTHLLSSKGGNILPVIECVLIIQFHVRYSADI